MADAQIHIHDTFGHGGYLAKLFPNYQPRPEQTKLALLFDKAFAGEQHAIAEGPCGTGKSLAYLVPAIFNAVQNKKRALVATANIALQEQLVSKDLPLLQRALPWDFTFALLKGKNNYLCLRALDDTEIRQGFGMYERWLSEQVEEVLKWAYRTQTGDVSELPFIPDSRVWSKFSVSSEDCNGKDCPHYRDCHSRKAREAADTATIVVTNFHLLFAHLQVRKATGQDMVLPKFDYVVADEFHEASSIARNFFGVEVSEFAVGNLLREASRTGGLRMFVDKIKSESGAFFENLRRVKHSAEYDVRLRQGKPRASVFHHETLVKMLRQLGVLATDELDRGSSSSERETKALETIEKRADKIASTIESVCTMSDPEYIYWIEEDSKQRCKLVGKPLDVASIMRDELFEQGWPVVCTSATITTGNGSFDFIRRETGVPSDALELVADTPFNFRRQALLVVPDGLPEPNSPSFPEAAARVTSRVIELCNGRTLGLFTSYRNLNAVHEKIKHLDFRILKQGDKPRTELVREFKLDVHSVLLGTSSFWTGVDVSGEALTGLVIDKLPFPAPDDPIVDAMSEREKNVFGTYMIPQAIIALRQGVGRLIRSVDDVGVVVILDTRLATKNYGGRFLKSLPEMRSTRNVEAISTFLEEANGDEL